MLEAQILLKRGMYRRVGDGYDVNIKLDPWLPSEEDPYIHSTSESIEGQMISSLMVPSQRQWDEEVVTDIFDTRDANLIMSILLQSAGVDSWYWCKERMGNYTVKSAYLLLQDIKGAYQVSNNSGFWRKLWNLKIPSKVKHFLWRAITCCLPTKDQLRVKKVAVNALCPVCNAEEENVCHSFISCSFAKACWDNSGIRFTVGVFYSFFDWISSVFQVCRGKDLQLVAMLCWSL